MYPIILDATSILELANTPKGIVNQAIKPQPKDISYDIEVPFDYLIPMASRKRDVTWDGNGPARKDLYFEDEAEVIEFLSEFEECPYGKEGDLLWVKEAWGYLGCSTRGDAHKATVLYHADKVRRKITFLSSKEMSEATPSQKIKYPDDFDELEVYEQASMESSLLDDWWKRKRYSQARWMSQWASRFTLKVLAIDVKQLDNGLFVWAINFETVK